MLKDLANLIRDTAPLIKLSSIDVRPSAIYLALSSMNPTGSVKDVMAWYMLTEAEKRGDLKRGDTILEVTTGNTGIAFAMLSAVHGYRFVAIMPEHMSIERRQIMKAYGAEVVLTPKEEDIPGALRKYQELKEKLAPKVWLPDQFGNEDNLTAHYLTTGQNIVQQLPGPVDYFAAGCGTGGTLLGVAKRLREHCPQCRIVAIEPEESAVLSGGSPHIHGIQGIGEGFVPALLQRHRDLIDEIAVVSTPVAEEHSRRLARQCGIFAGVSAGANLAVALELARRQPGSRIVTIIPDRGERYLNQGLFGCSASACADMCNGSVKLSCDAAERAEERILKEVH